MPDRGPPRRVTAPDLGALEALARPAYGARSDRAIWLQIYDRLLKACETGLLPPGTRLPAEQHLADLFDVSRVTLHRALAKLQQEGQLRARKGAGVFVRQRATRWRVENDARAATQRSAEEQALETRTLALGPEKAGRDVAAELGLSRGAKVIRLTRLRLRDGAPLYLATKYFPAARFSRFAESYAPRQSVRDVYAAHGIADWRRLETRISGTFAGTAEAEALELTPRTPLLAMTSVNGDLDGGRIELNRGFWPLSSVELIFY